MATHAPLTPVASPSIVIRDARLDERERIRELTLAAYREYATVLPPRAWSGLERAIHRALGAPDAAEQIVAECEGELLGSVLLYPPEVDAYHGLVASGAGPEIRLLAVPIAGRGRGVGEALVRECIRRATARGAPEIGLHTSRSMAGARRLYVRLGFERAPERDFLPDGGETVEGFRLALDR